ncbi:hypothetical protein IID27_00150 [Patescibacteria group bacterium]|nr:hypothetical protein [Patescibacteria group bacterium]
MDEQEQQNEAQEEQNVQMEPAPLSPPPSHTKLIVGIVFLLIAGIAGAYLLLQPKSEPVDDIQVEVSDQNKPPKGEEIAPTVNLDIKNVENEIDRVLGPLLTRYYPPDGSTIYVLRWTNKGIDLFNLTTGQEKIIGKYVTKGRVPIFIIENNGLFSPPYIVVRNEENNGIFRYDIKMEELEELIPPPDEDKAERSVYSFLDDDNKLLVSEYLPLLGMEQSLDVSDYLINVVSGVVTKYENGFFSERPRCGYEYYDSKHQRFFDFLCGEGIGSFDFPLIEVSTIDGSEYIVYESSFEDGDYIGKRDGLLFIFDYDKSSIVIVDPRKLESEITIYENIYDFVKLPRCGQRRWSSVPLFLPEDNIMILSDSDSISFLSFDKNNRLQNHNCIFIAPEKYNINVRSLFLYDNHLYFQISLSTRRDGQRVGSYGGYRYPADQWKEYITILNLDTYKTVGSILIQEY